MATKFEEGEDWDTVTAGGTDSPKKAKISIGSPLWEPGRTYHRGGFSYWLTDACINKCMINDSVNT